MRLGRVGVLDDVLQGFLGDPVERDLGTFGQLALGHVHLDIDLGDGTGQAGEPVREAEVVEHRGTQPGDGRAALVQSQVGQVPGDHELLGTER